MGNEIKLDYEFFQSLSGSFADVFELTDNAADYAYQVDNSLPMKNYIILEKEALQTIITLILDSFTSTDQNLKQSAQEIVGVEIHNAISSGAQVTVNPDGSYSINYPIKDYQGLRQHLSDNCTNTCLAMMIQRYYLYHTGKCDLYYDDINKNAFYWSVENYGRIKSNDLPNGGHYQTGGDYPSKLKELGNGNPQAGLAEVLKNHPEGVVIYGRYGNGGGQHAILITDCKVDENGNYSFTSIDPATGKETPLVDSTLYNSRQKYNSVDDLLNNLFFYQYLDSVT